MVTFTVPPSYPSLSLPLYRPLSLFLFLSPSLSLPPSLSLSLSLSPFPSLKVSQLESQLASASEKLNTSLNESHRAGMKVEAAERKASETEETLKKEQVKQYN